MNKKQLKRNKRNTRTVLGALSNGGPVRIVDNTEQGVSSFVAQYHVDSDGRDRFTMMHPLPVTEWGFFQLDGKSMRCALHDGAAPDVSLMKRKGVAVDTFLFYKRTGLLYPTNHATDPDERVGMIFAQVMGYLCSFLEMSEEMGIGDNLESRFDWVFDTDLPITGPGEDIGGDTTLHMIKAH